MQFILKGVSYRLDPATLVEQLRGVAPEPMRTHGVRVGSVTYPVRQAFEYASNIPRAQFTSQEAIRHLRALGFEIVNASGSPAARAPLVTSQAAPVTAADAAHRWPWEGSVQTVFADLLRAHGWSITAEADTATKAPGVDILAMKADRRLGAEVKGWPSKAYADPRRAAEVKRTPPSTQAVHWFSQALLKATMLLDTHPGYESLMVVPDFPRFRDLTKRTRIGRRAANIHVILLDSDGAFTSERWSP